MFATDDTIVAVASPPGHGGIGVVRLSGDHASRIGGLLARREAPWRDRRATRVHVDTSLGAADAIVTFFAGPRSYTGEDVLEVSAHSNPVILAAIVEAAVAHGARAARRGEFTLRAFLHGKLDLVQAEAVREVIDAVSPAQLRAATDHLDGTLSQQLHALAASLRDLEERLEASVDFPDEGYRFIEPSETASALQAVRERMARLAGDDTRADLVRNGARVAIAGAPNVGKSSLFNAVLGVDRAIVTSVPGTTRDLVSERVVMGGELATLIDTAGLRTSVDVVEAEGIRRAVTAVERADVVLVVVDRSRPLDEEEREVISREASRAIVVVNKIDVPAAWSGAPVEGVPSIEVSARTGAGVDALVRLVAERIVTQRSSSEASVVVNARQRSLIAEALTHLERAVTGLEESGNAYAEELVIADVRAALGALDGVTGRRTSDDVLAAIFARFCIGK